MLRPSELIYCIANSVQVATFVTIATFRSSKRQVIRHTTDGSKGLICIHTRNIQPLL